MSAPKLPPLADLIATAIAHKPGNKEFALFFQDLPPTPWRAEIGNTLSCVGLGEAPAEFAFDAAAPEEAVAGLLREMGGGGYEFVGHPEDNGPLERRLRRDFDRHEHDAALYGERRRYLWPANRMQPVPIRDDGGPSYAEKHPGPPPPFLQERELQDRLSKVAGDWYRWFAWRPVVLGTGEWAWLRTVERRDYLGHLQGEQFSLYREPQDRPKGPPPAPRKR